MPTVAMTLFARRGLGLAAISVDVPQRAVRSGLGTAAGAGSLTSGVIVVLVMALRYAPARIAASCTRPVAELRHEIARGGPPRAG